MAQADLKAFTAELANELGATVDGSAADWNGIIDTADGLRLRVTQSGDKGCVRAWLKRGRAFPGDTIPCGEIGATFTRGAVAVAKDVERRLLPEARKLAGNARDNWAKLDNETECLKRLADELRAAGAEVTFVDEGRSAQRLSIRKSNMLHKPTGGTLVQATVSGGGSVTVERVWLYDHADKMDKLKAILALAD